MADLRKLREELKQQQRQALEAALQDKARNHDDDYVGLGFGWIQLIASLEATWQAVDRLIEEEGGE